jgi:CBS domain-containing protein
MPTRAEPGTQDFREGAHLATLLPEIMVTVRDVMSTDLVTVGPSTSVAEAATVMGGRHVGSAIVLGDGEVSGIFTERDVLRALATDFDAAHHAVEQWMTHGPATIAPEAGVREARDLMLERGFRHLPVVEDGNLVGIVSLRDLFRGEP